MQFRIYEYKRASHYKMFVDVQSDILDTPDGRMAIPLRESCLFSSKVNPRIFPIVYLNGEAYRMITTDMSRVTSAVTGDVLGDVSQFSDEIKDALNLMFWGI